jgi:septum formation protein
MSETTVRFKQLSDDEIRRYVATGEPFDKAGAYGIQGKAGMFIEHISGSYTGVMGLPVFETARLLSAFGYRTL